MKPGGDCPKCGTRNTYSEKLCNMCGELLPWAQPQVVTPPPAVQSAPPAPAAPSASPPSAMTNVGQALNVAASNSFGRIIIGTIAGIIFFVVMFVVLVNVGDSPGSSPPLPSTVFHDFSPVVTMSEYSQVQNGMSYSQVANIIGDPGRETTRSEVAGFTTVGYSWQNSDGSNMQAMFQNGALITKAQAGLR
jgi:hypothetical protein